MNLNLIPVMNIFMTIMHFTISIWRPFLRDPGSLVFAIEISIRSFDIGHQISHAFGSKVFIDMYDYYFFKPYLVNST